MLLWGVGVGGFLTFLTFLTEAPTTLPAYSWPAVIASSTHLTRPGPVQLICLQEGPPLVLLLVMDPLKLVTAQEGKTLSLLALAWDASVPWANLLPHLVPFCVFFKDLPEGTDFSHNVSVPF